MTCLGSAPATADAGGPAWQQSALIGLATLVVIAALVLLLGVIVWVAR